MRNIEFKSGNNETVRGVLYEPTTARPHPAIIFAHGLLSTHDEFGDYPAKFCARGYLVLAIDFRGHGASDGDYTSLVYFERDDVLAALDYLCARGITRVGLLGFSMGGAVALATAALSPLVVGVISDCTFAELWHITRQAARRRGVPEPFALVAGWLIVLFASMRLRANLFSADPVRWIGKIAPRPVLIMHGAADSDVPVAAANQLWRAAREPKELWLVPGATHRKIEEVAREEYRQRVVEFFERAFENQ